MLSACFATIGVDVAIPVTETQWTCLQSTQSVQYAIVRVRIYSGRKKTSWGLTFDGKCRFSAAMVKLIPTEYTLLPMPKQLASPRVRRTYTCSHAPNAVRC